MIGQGELAKGAGSESNSCEQILSPNYIDYYVQFGMVMQFVKYSRAHCHYKGLNKLKKLLQWSIFKKLYL